jgi:hypothetical protein
MTTENQFTNWGYFLEGQTTTESSQLRTFAGKLQDWKKENPDYTPSQLKAAGAKIWREAIAEQSAYAKTHPHPVKQPAL